MIDKHLVRWAMGMLMTVAAGLLVGCATTPESQFYVLQPRGWHAPKPAGIGGDRITIGLQRVSLPGYMDRSQIVTSKGGVGIDVAEFHRWGEPLDLGMARVLCDTLKDSLAPHTVLAFPWGDSKPDLHVKVLVDAFVATPGKKARLAGDCRLTHRDGRSASHRFAYERPVASDYTNMVQGMSALVDDLGRGLAEKIAERR